MQPRIRGRTGPKAPIFEGTPSGPLWEGRVGGWGQDKHENRSKHNQNEGHLHFRFFTRAGTSTNPLTGGSTLAMSDSVKERTIFDKQTSGLFCYCSRLEFSLRRRKVTEEATKKPSEQNTKLNPAGTSPLKSYNGRANGRIVSTMSLPTTALRGTSGKGPSTMPG